MPAMGWLVSQLGQRNVYVLGVLGTTVATVLCGLAWSMESLIAFRVVQGAVGASVMSIGMVLLYEAFPTEQRGLAMGLFIMVASHGLPERGAFGMIFSASDTAIMRTLPAADRSMGAGLHNMHRGIAMAFGVALGSVLLEKRLAFHALLTAHTRLAAYQDCLLVISIGMLAALMLAWQSRTRVLPMSQPLPVLHAESVQAEEPVDE